ncbi:MAG TPA: threonine synthase [Rubricoccaceae bacterium]
MRYRSTADPAHRATFREAVLNGTPPGGGLYVPEAPPALPAGFAVGIADRSSDEIAFALARAFIGADEVSDADLADAVGHTLAFPLPLVAVEPGLSVLELFHGPTLAFKDVGARFLAAMLGLFRRDADRDLVVLVATSGDTGGAVAAGLSGTPGVSTVVLYPEGRVSGLQEKQFAALGGNAHALRVAGSFDDCQRIVKAMFADASLRARVALTSANSISVARLVPQTFYYAALAQQWARLGVPGLPAVVVPSGNVGNLTAGLLARRAGVPLGRFVAATNANALLSDVLGGATYAPRPSLRTLSTAMDVGDPSNLARLLDFYGSAASIAADVEAVSVDDEATRRAMRQLADRTGYVADPHTSVGVAALERVRGRDAAGGPEEGVVLATAHPAKFPDEVEHALGRPVPVPERLALLASRPTVAEAVPPEARAVRDWLIGRFGDGW